MPTDAAGVAATEVKFCISCVTNCATCTIDDKGAQTCTKCSATATAPWYLAADGKSCVNADCSGSDGIKCNKCVYG
jgi:hypothetical protein